MTQKPLPAIEVFANQRAFNWLRVDGDALLWIEGRPSEARAALVRWQDGVLSDVNPQGESCSNVVGYGGIPFLVTPDGDTLYCSSSDQRVYSARTGEAITAPSKDKAVRWADFIMRDGFLYGVRETHEEDGWIDNDIVRQRLDDPDSATVLVSGFDFVGAPRISPDGTQLAWVGWNAPQMPWDGTELWVATISDVGLVDARRVAGSTEESVQEPTWTPDGALLYMSDRTGWWNLYQDGVDEALVRIDADMSEPYWSVGLKTYDLFADGRILVRWTTTGSEHLGLRHPDGTLEEIETPYTRFIAPSVYGDKIAVIAAGPRHLARITVIDPSTGGAGDVIRDNGLTEPEVISVPELISYPTTNDATAYAFWYAPSAPTAPDGGPLPIIVNSHGGPTGHVPPTLDLRQQYWTSRGYGYLEINFRGSSGHGRVYRNALRGNWGVVDIDDAVAGAEYLVDKGIADPRKLFVRGLSGGGWLTLCCMAFRDTFAAGGCMNGVADARGFSAKTHKFEAHYLETLLGPEAQNAELYEERSPITAAHNITAPLIILQGEVDDVVPRDQADVIVEVLERLGREYEYHLYEGEGHLFAKAENLVHALEAETAFFERVLARVEA